MSLCLKNNKDLLLLFHTTCLSCVGKALGSLVTQRTQADRVADISDVFGLSARGRKNSGISYLAVKILFPGGKSLLSLTTHCLELVTGLYPDTQGPKCSKKGE